MFAMHHLFVALVLSAPVVAFGPVPLEAGLGPACPDGPIESRSALPDGAAGRTAASPSAQGQDGGDHAAAELARAAGALRPASEAERATFLASALASIALESAGARLAPLTIDTTDPRVVGSTVGQVGVYFPVQGGFDGPVGQYAIWFDTATAAVVAEADMLRGPDGPYLRLVLDGEVRIDGPLRDDGLEEGDFWDCLRMCVGEVLDHNLYVLLRSACHYACKIGAPVVCQGCLVAAGALEAGMVSGCTHTCWQR